MATEPKTAKKRRCVPKCRGSGKIRMQKGFFVVEQACPHCHGTGRMVKEACPDCKGAGVLNQEKDD